MVASMKKHPALWIAPAVLVVLLLAALWYTRPVAFSDLNGIGDSPITSFSGAMSIPMVENGQPYFDTWTIQTEDDWGDVAGLLRDTAYRRSLTNLLFWDTRRSLSNPDGSIVCMAVLKNGESVSVFLVNDGLVELNGVIYRVGGNFFALLSEAIRENGTYQE